MRTCSSPWPGCPTRARAGDAGISWSRCSRSACARCWPGARSYVAIAEWAHDDLPVSVGLRLGTGRRAPSESTIRRVLQAVDLDALDVVLSRWLAARLPGPPPGRMRVVAVDGKTTRGARVEDRTQVHLLAAFDHACGVVLGQTQVESKTNELIGSCAAPGRAENFVVAGRVDTA